MSHTLILNCFDDDKIFLSPYFCIQAVCSMRLHVFFELAWCIVLNLLTAKIQMSANYSNWILTLTKPRILGCTWLPVQENKWEATHTAGSQRMQGTVPYWHYSPITPTEQPVKQGVVMQAIHSHLYLVSQQCNTHWYAIHEMMSDIGQTSYRKWWKLFTITVLNTVNSAASVCGRLFELLCCGCG